MLVSLELDAQPVIEDPQVAVGPARDCIRCDRLHVLRHHADIGFVAAVIAEAIVPKATGEIAEQNDIVLERDVRSPSAAAATTTATAATTAATAARTCATAAAAHTCATATATAAAAEACVSTRSLCARSPAGPNIPKGVAAARRPGAGTRTCTGPLPSARPLCTAATRARPISCSCAGPIPAARSLGTATTGAGSVASLPAATRLEHLLTAAATVIHAVLSAVTNVVVAKFVLHVGVVVSHAPAMLGPVLPIVSAVIDIDGPIDVDVVSAPIGTAAPIISA